MKTILSLTLAAALTLGLFTGCGCAANVSTNPNGMITEETTRPAVMPTPTATHATEPTQTRPHTTTPTGANTMPTDGAAESTPDSTTGESVTPTDSTMEPRGRGRMPGR